MNKVGIGGPERTRTSDLRFRKPLLYPAELRDQDGNGCFQPPFRDQIRSLNMLWYMRLRPNRKTAWPPLRRLVCLHRDCSR